MNQIPTSFAEKIYEQVEQGRKGSGGISDRAIVYQGLRYYPIDVQIAISIPDGGKVNVHYDQRKEPTGMCILFKRHEERVDRLDFVVLNEKDEVVTTSQEGATGYVHAVFARENGKKVFGLALFACKEGGTRQSDLLLSDDKPVILFLHSIGGVIR